MRNYKPIPEKMQKHSELINNTITDPVILAAVATYGYTPEKLDIGKSLLNETADLIVKHGDEDAEQAHADDDFKMQRIKINEKFTKHQKLAAIALDDKPLLLKLNLGVNGQASDVYSEWISDIDLFYGNALKSDEILAALAELNITKEILEAMQAEIATMKTLKLNQKKEMGEAQMATKERDKKISELDKWARRYKKVAHITFEDQPQILEKLGILVRS